MIRLEFLRLNIGTAILRFYLMMAVVIIGGVLGAWWLAMFALPIFISCILGIKMSFNLKGFRKTRKIIDVSALASKTKAV